MKKFIKLVVSMILCLGVFVGATACGGGGSKNDPNTIYVCAKNDGYGTEWVETMLEEFFETNDLYSNYKCEIIPAYDDDTTKTQVENSSNCYYDLVVQMGGSRLIEKEALVDISSVYNMSYKGKKLKDEMDETIVSNFKRTESGSEAFYVIPFVSGTTGIVVNYSLVSNKLGANWESQYPCRTTDEFIEFIDAIRGNGVVPFGITVKDFYSALYETWWGQYEGMEGVENYYNAKKYVEGMGYTETADAFMQDGTLESLLVMEEIFSYSKPATEKNFKYYNDATSLQYSFMTGETAMIVNGSWMMNEMVNQKHQGKIDMRFIRMPIISALTDKLSFSEDSKLAEVIDYVNGKTLSVPSGVTNEDVNLVRERSRILKSNVDYSDICIPLSSKKQDVVIDFLKWMYSEEGQDAYVDATGGLFLPVNNSSNASKLASLDKFYQTYTKYCDTNITYLFGNMNWKFSKAGLIPFTARKEGPIESLLAKTSGNDKFDTAYEIYQYNTGYYREGNNWGLLQNGAR